MKALLIYVIVLYFIPKPRDDYPFACLLLWFDFVVWTELCALFDVIR